LFCRKGRKGGEEKQKILFVKCAMLIVYLYINTAILTGGLYWTENQKNVFLRVLCGKNILILGCDHQAPLTHQLHMSLK